MFAAPLVGALGIGMGGAGSVLGAAGSILGGFSKAGMYNYQAGIADANARIERQNAEYSLQTGDYQAMESGMKTAAKLGQATTRQAAGNIAVGSGSAADVQGSITKLGDLDKMLIQRAAGREAYGHEVQSAVDIAQAGAYRSAASTSVIGGVLGGLGSLASGASSVASKWLTASAGGLFNPDNPSLSLTDGDQRLYSLGS